MLSLFFHGINAVVSHIKIYTQILNGMAKDKYNVFIQPEKARGNIKSFILVPESNI